MKKRVIGFVLVAAILWIFSARCSEEVKTNDNFVVEAYVYADEPIKNIKIKYTTPITETETTGLPVTDATVALKRSGKEYFLTYNNATNNYFYSGGDFQVKPGDALELSVTSKTRTATATTVVPLATKDLKISTDKIYIPPILLNSGTKDQLTQLFAKARIKVNWDNSGNQLHFIAIESLDSFDPIFPKNFPAGVITLFRTFRFVTAPNRESTYDVVGLSLETYGRYRIKVYRVNKEYADLFENQTQDSRDLNAPPSNIRNAFGIFSAFASDSAFFEVLKN
jgi:hypothetical protein